jgi:DNA helicase II / ATP-dependent DNA helicase PcrA
MRYLTLWNGIGDVTAGHLIEQLMSKDHLDGCLNVMSKEPKVPKRAMGAVKAVRDFQMIWQKLCRRLMKRWKSYSATSTRIRNGRKGAAIFLWLRNWRKNTRPFRNSSKNVLNPVYETVRSPRDDQDRVVIITIHSAKGTEREVCYVMNVSPQAYPTGYAIGHFDRTEEERRVLYVALTRAKDELIVTRHAPRGSEGYNLWAHSNYSAEEDAIETYFFNSLPESLFEEHVHYQSPPSVPCGAPKAKGGLQVGIRIG